MRLLAWRPVGKGALVGRADIQLPNGLQISDIGLFRRDDGARWAQMPSEIVRDADGQPLKDDRGRFRYRTPIKWSSRDLQEGFSRVLFQLVEMSAGNVAETPEPSQSTQSISRSRRAQHRADTGPDLPNDDVSALFREMVP